MDRDEILEAILANEYASNKSHGMTSQAVIVSVAVSATVALLEILLFSYLQNNHSHLYDLRKFLAGGDSASQESWIFSWIVTTYKTSLADVSEKAGLDAFFFMRYIVFSLIVLVSICILVVPCLIPLHAMGHVASPTEQQAPRGLDILTISNISWSNRNRYIVHLVLCVLIMLFLLVAFYRELHSFYRIRAQFLLENDNQQSSNVILIKGLYTEYQSVDGIYQFYSQLPTGHIKSVSINRDLKVLIKCLERRTRLRDQLETLTTQLIRSCLRHDGQNEIKEADIVGNAWREYLHGKEQQAMGAKRGSQLTMLKSELSRINSQAFLLQSQSDLFPQVNSCFVEFDSPVTCFMALRSIGVDISAQTKPYSRKISPGAQCIGSVHISDVIWTSLARPTWLELLIYGFAVIIDFVVIFGWAFPMAALSVVTQAEFISEILPQLKWFRSQGASRIMSSVVSPLLLSYLTSQAPHIFRWLARLKGYPTGTLVEVDVQQYLFMFMFFQMFLIVTLSTGVLGLLMRLLLDTSEGAMSLANGLPKASNFFMSYVVASSLSTSGNVLLQSWHLIKRTWRMTFANTPRKYLEAMVHFPRLRWGSLYPIVTNCTAIAIAYALVSPLILVAAIIGTSCLYVAYKYRILHSHVPQWNSDGQFYPYAIFQLFSGLYCQQLSLLGTFLISRQDYLALCAAIIMICTACGHYWLNRVFHDLRTRIPARIASSRDDIKLSSNGTELPKLRLAPDMRDVFSVLDMNTPKISDESGLHHPAVHSPRSCVWLPRDEKGVAADQVNELVNFFSDIRATCAGAEMTSSGHIRVSQYPPDFSIGSRKGNLG